MASDSATGRSPPLARAVRRTVMFYDHRNLGEQGKEHRIRRLAICLVKTREFSAVSRFAETPAELSIRKAQEEIAKKPDHAPYYNALAMAYARRARETSDVAYYAKAQETLRKSLAIAPDNFEARKVEGHKRGLRSAALGHERPEVAPAVLSQRHRLAVDQRPLS